MQHPGVSSRITQHQAALILKFMGVYQELCPSGDDEVTVQAFADRIRWTEADVAKVAEWCRDLDLIDTDAGMGDQITIIEGRY